MKIVGPTVNHAVSVIGLGNVFLGDDGFGPLALEAFRCHYACGPEVEVIDLGTPGADLAPYLYGRKLVVIVDAVHANISPHAVSVFREDDFLSSNACFRITGHDPGLWDTLTHLRLADCGPSELIVIGAAPQSCEFGDGPGETMLGLASKATLTIAQELAGRAILCNPRSVALQPNFWWLPLVSHERRGAAEDIFNA